MSAKRGSGPSQRWLPPGWWKTWLPDGGKSGPALDAQVSYLIWNTLTGARIAGSRQVGTRTPARVASRALALALAAWVAFSLWGAAGQPGTEWTVDGVEQILADAIGRVLERWPWLPRAAWVAAAGALAAAGWAATAWALDWHHNDYWVRSLHRALGKDVWGNAIGGMKPRDWLKVPRDFAEAPGGVRVRFPIDFPVGEPRTKAEMKVLGKLPLGDINTHWEDKGPYSFLQVTAQAKVPDKVLYADPAVAADVATSKPGKPMLGRTATGNYIVDLQAATPHGLFSAGTGGGKSTGVKAIAAQEMRHGAGVIVLDAIKRKSQRWAKDPATKWKKPIPGVIYCRTIPQMHRTLVDLGRELDRRQEASEELPDDQELDEPRIIVICEELNATMKRLQRYWRKIRNDPELAGEWVGETDSPAVLAYMDGLQMGRAERVNLLAVAQMGTARALGGGEARENYGLRGLARFSEQARKMLIPTASRMFRSSTKVGRWVMAQGEDFAEVQLLYMTDVEARMLAMSGKPSRLPFSQHGHGPSGGGRPTLHVVRDGQAQEPRTLSEISRDHGEGLVDETLATLRQGKSRYRHQGYPRAVGRQGSADLFVVAELQRWWAEKRAADQVEQEVDA